MSYESVSWEKDRRSGGLFSAYVVLQITNETKRILR